MTGTLELVGETSHSATNLGSACGVVANITAQKESEFLAPLAFLSTEAIRNRMATVVINF